MQNGAQNVVQNAVRFAGNPVDDDDECPICHDLMLPEALPVVLPECGHRICYDCIKTVAINKEETEGKALCCICRAEFDPEILKNMVVQMGAFTVMCLKYRQDIAGIDVAVHPGEELEEEEEEEDIKPDVEELNAQMAAGIPGTSAPARRGRRAKKDNDVFWLYQRLSGGWWRYNFKHEYHLESAYGARKEQHDMRIVGNMYRIDFTRGIQYEIKTGKARWIRRITRAQAGEQHVVGIAGVRIANVFDL